MRKYLISPVLLTLTGCMGGGGESSLLLYMNDINNTSTTSTPDFGSSMFLATPEETMNANKPIINIGTVWNFSDRIVEIWNKSGINLDNVPESELPVLNMDGIRHDIYDEMSDEKKLTLRKAQYIQNLIEDTVYGVVTLSSDGLRDVAMWINAFYDVESKGKIGQKLNPDEITNENLSEFFSNNRLLTAYDYSIGGYYVEPVRIELLQPGDDENFCFDENGVITNGHYGYSDRIGNTNEFDYNGETHIFNSFNNGKLSYLDFGTFTRQKIDPDTGEMLYSHTGVTFESSPHAIAIISSKITPEDWVFKGSAVGVYSKRPDSGNNWTANSITMQTDNATLTVNGDVSNSITVTVDMPFSDADWYDVKFTHHSGDMMGVLEFSNYGGVDENRLFVDTNNGDPIVTGGYGGAVTDGDYMFSPAEATGVVDYSTEDERFSAAFGMKRVE